MTRKHFKLIADGVAQIQRDAIGNVQFDEVVWRLSDALSTTNPNFDRTRFSRACKGQK